MSNNITFGENHQGKNQSETEQKETNIDPKQLAKDIKYLKAELNFKSKQLNEKFELLYQLKQEKDTYDNIIITRGIKAYE